LSDMHHISPYNLTDMTIISHNFTLIHTFCMRFDYHKQLM